jgi:high-affinity nickel-transport protein
MIATGAFTVFALGLRHGADPDHLAAIDNLTRNSMERKHVLSRFTGALFAGGHTVMVMAIAAIVGFAGARFASHAAIVEHIGMAISIAVLVTLAIYNIRQLARGATDRVVGAKTRLLPAVLRDAKTPWLAIPVGLLFGFGFETSSQIAAYAVAFGADAGIVGALIVGSMFCVGMCATDTLDSVMVHRLVTYRAGRLPHVMRVWIWSVTLFALGVAGYEAAQLSGYSLPLNDTLVSGALVLSLLAVFLWIYLSTRSDDRVIPALEHLP